jgi:hypothetical protein
MKKLYTLMGFALLVGFGVFLLNCNRQSSGEAKSLMLLDQDPRSVKDSAIIVTRDSPAFAKGVERPHLSEPPPWLKLDDAHPNAMEIDGIAPRERLDYSKGVPIPIEPKEGMMPAK